MKKIITVAIVGLVLFVTTTMIGNAYVEFQYAIRHCLVSNRTICLLEAATVTVSIVGAWMTALYLHVKEIRHDKK